MQRITGRKLPIRLLAVNGLLALLLVGCGPIVRRAPFAQRPDSVKRGSALGPFEGRVVDTDTQAPVSEALVWCGWSFSRGIGNQAPERVETTTTRTNADGAYRVRALRRFPQGLSTHLSKFTMVIYKKGYVAYRHDRIFNHRRRRRTFSQYGNEVRLSRWSPELSHMRHLLFIGSAPALAKASARRQRREASHTQTVFYGIPIESDRVCFVLDVSGSMSEASYSGGMRIDAVKKELLKAIESLPDGAWFNLLFFDTSVYGWKRELMEMNEKQRASALDYASKQGPGGGTAAGGAIGGSTAGGGGAPRPLPLPGIFLSNSLREPNVVKLHLNSVKRECRANAKTQ